MNRANVSLPGLLVPMLALTACRMPPPQPPVAAPSAALSYSAEIRRTSFGIPHVIAEDEAGIGYGSGYAYAQDNICQFAEVIVTVNSERSRYFGPDAIDGPDVESYRGRETNLERDLFYKLVNAPEHVRKAWEEQDASAKALMQGYAAGFNRYLTDTGIDRLPPACRNAPWIRELDELDIVRFMRRFAVEASSARLTKEILAAKPPEATATQATSTAVIDLPQQLWEREFRQSIGSNAAAFGRDATENGRGLLLGNPHYPWYGSLRFYQIHQTIPGKLDVMGATLGGLPVVILGFNQKLAWSHTVNTSEHAVIYWLEMDEADPTRYFVDGQARTLERRTVSVDAREKDGTITQRTHDFWLSEYGPLLVLSKDMPWSKQTAYALRDLNFDNNRLVETWYAMGRAGSLDELQSAVTTNLGLPWVNTLAADAAGGTLYMDVTVVPNVSKTKQQACVADAHRPLVARGLFVLKASGACELDSSPGAPQSGVFAGNEMPILRRSDFIQNSNDSAWMTNPDAPLSGYPAILSTQDEPLDGRTRLGISQAQARLLGSDGLAGKRFDADKLKTIAFSNRSYFGTLLYDDLVAVCKGAGTVTVDERRVDLAKACTTFKSWDRHANLDSVGYPLATAWIENLLKDGGFWVVPFSKQDPVNTPHGIRRNDIKVVEQVRSALARAVLKLKKNGIDPAKPWGQIQVYDVNGRRIPMHGGVGSGIYNLVGGDYSLFGGEAQDGLIHVRGGSSYIQVVAFDENGPQAEAFLTYSQSTNPASPHFSDQAPRFAALDWIKLPFTDDEVRSDPQFATMSIEE